MQAVEGLPAAALQRTRLPALGQEGRHPVHLRDGQQPTGAQRGADAGQGGGGVVQVVQGRRRPDEVGVDDPGQPRTGVGLQRVHTIAEPPAPGRRGEPLQHRGGAVDSGHPGGREPLQQGERAGPGARAEVDDVPDVVPGQAGDTPGERGQVGCEEGGVEVEDLGETVRRRGRVVGVSRMTVLVLVLVFVSHGIERTGPCVRCMHICR